LARFERTTSVIGTVDFVADGTLLELPTDTPKLAVGAEQRSFTKKT